MPPQLPSIRRCLHCSTRSPLTSIYSDFLPLITSIANNHQQTRSASILSSLSDNKGAYSKRIRRGRGPASGKGKTSGRGHGGQKAHGKVPAGFEGGQTPVHIVKGERGFTNNFSVDMAPINLDRIQDWINQGRLDPSKPITLKELCASRCLHGLKDGVKLLGRNKEALTTPINIVVSRASAEAIKAVEAAGGSVLTRYYTPFCIKKIKAGLSDPIYSLQSAPQSSLLPFPHISAASAPESSTSRPASIEVTQSDPSSPSQDSVALQPPISELRPKYRYRLADPVSRKDLEYYRDPAHRGYLAWQVKEGEGPSLYFKPPQKISGDLAGAGLKKSAGDKKQKKAELNRLW